MANPRRNKGDIQGQYGLSDLLGLFRDYAKGDIPDSPRQRQAVRNIARDVNLPTALPVASTSLLEAQPQQLATGIMGMSPVEDIVTGETQDMQSMIQPLLTQPETINNLLTKKEEEEIAKDPVALRKFSKAGDLFASFGGFQEFSPTSPEGLDAYNKQKLAARNRGIGEMLLMLSDALGGRDVAMRALERQKAKQPAKVKATEAIKQEELAVLQRLKELEPSLKEDETIEDLVKKLSPYEQILYNSFIRKEDAESFVSQFLPGGFGGESKQRTPIKITQIEEG